MTFSGADSSITVSAGEQVYVATGLQAAQQVSVSGNTAGDTGELGIVVDTRGGIYAAGLSSDGSGGHVELLAQGSVEIIGHVVSGANVQIEYDANNNFISRSFVWSDEASDVLIDVDGQAFIGGNTTNTAGDAIVTGGYVYANERIQIDGGAHSSGIGVRVHAASEIVTDNPDSSIEINALEDAEIFGVVLAGATVTEQRDANGIKQGRSFSPNYAENDNDGVFDDDGTSTIAINASEQIRIGTDLGAWSRIDLVGGIDPLDGSQFEGRGIVLLGSANLATWAENSAINLNAPGRIDILAPGHAQEILADGWPDNAAGIISDAVRLDIRVDKIDFVIEASVEVLVDDTNNGIADLRDDLQGALEGATWTVIGNNGDVTSPAVGSQFTDFAADPDIDDAP